MDKVLGGSFLSNKRTFSDISKSRLGIGVPYIKVLILGYFDVVFPAYAFRGPHHSQKYAHKMDFELSISNTHTVHKKVPNANGNSRIFRIFRIANITYKSLIALPLNLLKIRFGSTGSV